ncbi:2510_t:CDS:2, partial [Dentiscutata erythropus]
YAPLYAAQLIVYKEEETDKNVSELQAEKLAKTFEIFSLFSDQPKQQKYRNNGEYYLEVVKECNQLLEKQLEEYQDLLNNPVLQKFRNSNQLRRWCIIAIGYDLIGGVITLAGSAIDSITSKIEELDEKDMKH